LKALSGKALNLVRYAIAGLCAVAAVACQSAPLPSPNQIANAPSASMDGYRLGTGDEIKVTVFDEPSFSGVFIVDGLGMISMNLVGQIEVKNLTLKEVQAVIEAKYREPPTILRNPRVSAEMVKGRPYYILGEVNKQGEYPFTSGLTVMNAIVAAGGFTYRANQRIVMITSAADGVEREVQLTPLTQVRPGDRIRLKERLF
jgi:protein involved in polysaccharide export with SLBB domain